jgi:hypothetical protein
MQLLELKTRRYTTGRSSRLFDFLKQGATYAAFLVSNLKGTLQYLEAEILYYKVVSEFIIKLESRIWKIYPPFLTLNNRCANVIARGNNVGIKILLLHLKALSCIYVYF